MISNCVFVFMCWCYLDDREITRGEDKKITGENARSGKCTPNFVEALI